MLGDPGNRRPKNIEHAVKNRTQRQQDAQVQQILNSKSEISVARIAEENWVSKSEKKSQARTHHDGGEHGRETLD